MNRVYGGILLLVLACTTTSCVAASTDEGVELTTSDTELEPMTIDPNNTCDNWCKPITACSKSCTLDGVPTTCQQAGMCANLDADGDGVKNGVDNCVYTKNANQVNCDGDAYGNACDFENGTFQLVS